MQTEFEWAAAVVERVAAGRALLPLSDACPTLLPLEYQTARNQLSAGRFPLPVVKIGGKNFLRVYDLVIFLSGQSAPPPTTPSLSASAPQRRRGRPRKTERGAT